MRPSSKETLSLSNLLYYAREIAGSVLISPLSNPYTAAHRWLARLQYIDKSNQELIYHATLWELALLDWSGNYLIDIYDVYKELCEELHVDPMLLNEMASIRAIDGIIHNGGEKELAETVNYIGLSPVAKNAFIAQLELYGIN